MQRNHDSPATNGLDYLSNPPVLNNAVITSFCFSGDSIASGRRLGWKALPTTAISGVFCLVFWVPSETFLLVRLSQYTNSAADRSLVGLARALVPAKSLRPSQQVLRNTAASLVALSIFLCNSNLLQVLPPLTVCYPSSKHPPQNHRGRVFHMPQWPTREVSLTLSFELMFCLASRRACVFELLFCIYLVLQSSSRSLLLSLGSHLQVNVPVRRLVRVRLSVGLSFRRPVGSVSRVFHFRSSFFLSFFLSVCLSCLVLSCLVLSEGVEGPDSSCLE